jgi:hypothetical protein
MTTTDVAIIKGGFFALFQLLTLIEYRLTAAAVQKIMWHYVAKDKAIRTCGQPKSCEDWK